MRAILGDTPLGRELRQLDTIYEEPRFQDVLGNEYATEFLSDWRSRADSRSGWLVVVGEYGTGKTALTRVLQFRWLRDYSTNPALPIPFRIELRDFARQFDARGLLHHFMDHNGLGHLPIEFVFSLIRSGRVVVLLDGYDEMAQYLSARERRTCLEALAQLSSGGARGLLTSRPNYFTEAEELQVFEVLYSSLTAPTYYHLKEARQLAAREAEIDNLLRQFLERYERTLRDLSPDQTEALVSRALQDDPAGREVILALLRRIFRTADGGELVSLSGKPVIIAYLLEIVEGLKEAQATGSTPVELNEWQVYKLIIDHLMIRDFRASPEIAPGVRRRFLQKLALFLSRRDHSVIYEPEFKDLVGHEFRRELERGAHEGRLQLLDRFFADLRRSATLTRAGDPSGAGWRFSHNSIREYLIAEYLTGGLEASEVMPDQIAITDAMRVFVASRSLEERRRLLERLRAVWHLRSGRRGFGQLLSLLWDGLVVLFAHEADPVKACLTSVCGGPIDLSDLELTRLKFLCDGRSADLGQVSFEGTELIAADLTGCVLTKASFKSAVLESVRLVEVDLRDAIFDHGVMVDCVFAEADIRGASFRGIAPADVSIVVEATGGTLETVRFEGENALGYLRFHGGTTERVRDVAVLQHHPNFDIAEKILGKLYEQSMRQRRGLEQRGASQRNVRFARGFVKLMIAEGYLETERGRREQVLVTERGREMLGRFFEEGAIPREMVQFFGVTAEGR